MSTDERFEQNLSEVMEEFVRRYFPPGWKTHFCEIREHVRTTGELIKTWEGDHFLIVRLDSGRVQLSVSNFEAGSAVSVRLHPFVVAYLAASLVAACLEGARDP